MLVWVAPFVCGRSVRNRARESGSTTITSRQRRMRAIGFPTANLCTDNELLPPYGVYATTVTLGRLAPSMVARNSWLSRNSGWRFIRSCVIRSHFAHRCWTG